MKAQEQKLYIPMIKPQYLNVQLIKEPTITTISIPSKKIKKKKTKKLKKKKRSRASRYIGVSRNGN